MYKLSKIYDYEISWLVAAGAAAFAALWNVVLVHRPAELRSSGVAAWWTVLCAVAVINACGWHWTAHRVARQSATADAPAGRFRRRQLRLSAVFVLGCGFRSLIPRADVQRFGLIDSWVSSVLIGRSVATAAELCFVAQEVGALPAACRRPGRRVPVRGRRRMAARPAHRRCRGVLLVRGPDHLLPRQRWPRNRSWSGSAASLLVAGGLIVWARRRAARGPFMAAALALGILYIIFMISCDIPMYISPLAGRPRAQGRERTWRLRPGAVRRLVAPGSSSTFSLGGVAGGDPVDDPLLQRVRLVEPGPRARPSAGARPGARLAGARGAPGGPRFVPRGRPRCT